MSKLNADYLAQHSHTGWRAFNVFECIDSTNRWLKEQTQYPIVCLAEEQTQGRGRNGNAWQSPDAENIYLSFNWSFKPFPKHFPLLSLWVGIVVAEVIESLGIKGHGVKWPNDLYWQQKKMGGILIETKSSSTGVVIGLGINANVSTIADVDQPWTSLSEALGANIDRSKFLVTLLDALYLSMESFQDLDSEALQKKWLKWDLIKGKSITFLHEGETIEGKAQGIDPLGYLLVALVSGEVKAFNTSISKVRW